VTKPPQLALFGEGPESGTEPSLAPPPASSSRFLRNVAEAPLRRPWHVVIPFVLIVLAAGATGFLMPKMYRSTTLIMVESEKMPASVVQRIATETSERRLVTIQQEILSRTRLEQIIKELNPYPGAASTTAGVEAMRGSIQILVKGSDAFTVSYAHHDPKAAQQVTARLATLFIDESMRAREKQVDDAYQFLDEQVVQARRELEIKDAALRQFKERQMGSLPEQTSANLASLQMIQQEHQGLETSLRDARLRRETLEGNRFDPLRPSSGTTSSGPEPPSELSQLRSQLLTLRGRYTEEHPDVQNLKARIAAIERQLREASRTGTTESVDPWAATLKTQKERLDLDIQAMETRLASLDERITRFRERVEQAPRTEQELATLTRDYHKLNENYLAMLNKKLDAQMSARVEKRWKGEQFTILDPAHFPETAYWPDRPLLLGIGIVLGLLAGFGAAVGAELLDSSVKDIEDLQSIAPFPVLASIPYFRPGKAGLGSSTVTG
jgi:polysaccharide chain length determinant protein (PEP-CTERM system associated)